MFVCSCCVEGSESDEFKLCVSSILRSQILIEFPYSQEYHLVFSLSDIKEDNQLQSPLLLNFEVVCGSNSCSRDQESLKSTTNLKADTEFHDGNAGVMLN
jgi:hypothetical protein